MPAIDGQSRWPSSGIDGNISKRLSIVSREMVIFTHSVFLTEIARALTIFSRA